MEIMRNFFLYKTGLHWGGVHFTLPAVIFVYLSLAVGIGGVLLVYGSEVLTETATKKGHPFCSRTTTAVSR